MNPIELTRTDVLWVVIGVMVCLTLAWSVTFWILRNKDKQIKALLLGGNALRLLTVILVVCATSILAVIGVLSEAVCAIFSGIVGYVLGSLTSKTQDNIG